MHVFKVKQQHAAIDRTNFLKTKTANSEIFSDNKILPILFKIFVRLTKVAREPSYLDQFARNRPVKLFMEHPE